jgi:hypothetical protein
MRRGRGLGLLGTFAVGSVAVLALTANQGSRTGVQTTRASFFSADDHARFLATYRYEATDARDRARPTADIQLAGWDACMTVRGGDDPDIVAQRIAARSGFTLGGGQAAVAAALRALCSDLNRSYRTAFDRDVARAQDLIREKWGRIPDEIKTGETGKLVCDYLENNATADGLSAFVTSNGTPDGAPLKLTVRAVAGALCPAVAYKLDNFYWAEV